MAIELIALRRCDVLTRHQTLRQAEIWIQGDKIIGIYPFGQVTQPLGAKIVDARGLLISPGWIDLQVNGGFGHDFTQDPESLWDVAAELPRFGTTSFLATIISAPPAAYERAMEVWLKGPPAGWHGAEPLGLHFEGPFLNLGKKGAHNPSALRAPDMRLIEDWLVEKGLRLVTLAPELPGALDMIKELRRRGIVISAGHSLASYEQAMAAFETGVSCGTHLYNAMPALEHRSPGLTGALLAHPQAIAGVIADNIHVHPAMLKLAWQAKGSKGLALVSDAMAALGMPPGEYQLADQEVTVDETTARLSDGTLAGSILTQDAALRNLMEVSGAPIADVIPTVSSTPAALLNLQSKGVIRPGSDADLTLVTPQGHVVMTITRGQIVYNTEPERVKLEQIRRLDL
jgi:N-acetylglucosamine-6-phosphate deacetylase